MISEQLDQSIIGRRINGRRGYFDAQFLAKRFANFISRSTRLQFYG